MNWKIPKLSSNIGILIGAERVSLIKVKPTRKGPELVLFDTGEIERSSENGAKEDEIISAIKEVVSKAGIKSSKVISILSGEDVIVRYFELPLLPRNEWETAIAFEARKHIPFRIEEMVSDFCVSYDGNGAAKKMKVTFVAAKKQVVRNHFHLLRKAGFGEIIIEAMPISLIRAFNFDLAADKAEKTSAIIVLDRKGGNISIVRKNLIYLTRDILFPDVGFSEEDKKSLMESLINEVRFAFRYHLRQYPGDIIEKISIAGDKEFFPVGDLLKKELDILVEIDVPGKTLNGRAMIPSESECLESFVLLGGGLRGFIANDFTIDLGRKFQKELAAAVVKEGRFLTRKAVTIWIAEIFFVSLILFGVHRFSSKEVKLVESLIEEIQLQRSKGKGLPGDIEQLKVVLQTAERKREFLSNIIENRPFLTEGLNELPELTPEGLWLTSVNFSDSEMKKGTGTSLRLRLKGVAFSKESFEEMDIVDSFARNINSSEKDFFNLFTGKELKSISTREYESVVVTDFEMECRGKR